MDNLYSQGNNTEACYFISSNCHELPMRFSKESKGLKLPPPNTVNSPFTFSIV